MWLGSRIIRNICQDQGQQYLVSALYDEVCRGNCNLFCTISDWHWDFHVLAVVVYVYWSDSSVYSERVMTFIFWCGSVSLCWCRHPIFIKHPLWGASRGIDITIIWLNRFKSARYGVELQVGNSGWCHLHKHTIPHRNLKLTIEIIKWIEILHLVYMGKSA